MPQSPRRNSQTQTNWADQLSANRYAAGAVVALLAAYLVAGRGEPPSSIPPGVTLIHGLEALAPPRPKGAAPLGGKWPLDVLDPVAPKAGTLVIYANVKRDDYLAPEPRTRHAHRALADGAPHHVHARVEIKFTARSPSTRRLLDGVAVPVRHRSTEPARPRHRREMT